MTKTRKLVFSIEMDVRWGDMDALGHVNNTVYFRYMEQARVSWLESLSGSITADTGPVIINASCTFLAPIVYPERLVVDVFAGAPGRSSFETHYEIRPAREREPLYAEGAAKVVWAEHAAGRSVAIPDAVRSLIEG